MQSALLLLLVTVSARTIVEVFYLWKDFFLFRILIDAPDVFCAGLRVRGRTQRETRWDGRRKAAASVRGVHFLL